MAKDHQQRAIRRHHLARLKAKRLDYYGCYARKLPRKERQLHVGKFAHTAKLCSCRGCGKPYDAVLTDADLLPLIAAIIKHENGVQPYPAALILKGIELERTA